ncbi:unnamed protein product, partial [Ixodes persulcatus]
ILKYFALKNILLSLSFGQPFASNYETGPADEKGGHALPARFTESYRNQTVRRGHAASLECRALGDAPISISWSRNGRRLDTHKSYALFSLAHRGTTEATKPRSIGEPIWVPPRWLCGGERAKGPPKRRSMRAGERHRRKMSIWCQRLLPHSPRVGVAPNCAAASAIIKRGEKEDKGEQGRRGETRRERER